MKNPVIGSLIAANSLLALALAAMWVDMQGQLRHVHWVRPEPIQADYMQMVPVLPGREQVRTDTFLALLERPLFSSTRRPPPPPPPPVPAPPPDLLSNAQVLGTYSGDGVSSGAIVRIDGKGRRVRLGESINGWQLSSVKERSAVFTSGGQTRELPLVRSKMAAGVDVPAARNEPPPASPEQQFQMPQVAPAGSAEPSAADPAPAATRRRPRFGP